MLKQKKTGFSFQLSSQVNKHDVCFSFYSPSNSCKKTATLLDNNKNKTGLGISIPCNDYKIKKNRKEQFIY